jgi:arylsulfatase A-like enzyme
MHRIFIAIACLAVSIASLTAEELAGSRPNIVFVLADDMGYGDARCFGGATSKIPTPHLDKLAAEGMRFTSALTTGSICVPSRAGIMSGTYAFRNRNKSKRPNGPWGYLGPAMSKGEFTLGHLMKRAGYTTGYVGKWHLGTEMATKTETLQQDDSTVDFSKPLKFGPPHYGFDYSFILPGSLDMFPYAFVKNNVWQGAVTSKKGWSAFNRVGLAAEDFEDTKVLDTFCSEAEAFLGRQKGSKTPFFMFVALTSPHTPISVSEPFKGKSGALGAYGDFVMETDHCFGRISAALAKNGFDENTLLIVSSDHGAATYAGFELKSRQGQMFEYQEKTGHRVCGPFKGYKFTIYEGGLRVPCVARWPGRVKAGSTCERLIGLQDLMATCAELSGHKLKDTEGVDSFSFVPLLANPQAQGRRRDFIYQSSNAYAFRQGDWKLIFDPGAGCGGKWIKEGGRETVWKDAIAKHGKVKKRDDLLHPDFVQLFNLANDLHEDNDLSATMPEKLREMYNAAQQQVDSGRATPGPKVSRPNSTFKSLFTPPPFVWAKK